MHRHKGRHLRPRVPKEELRLEPEAAGTEKAVKKEELLKPLPLRSVVFLRVMAVLLAVCTIGIPLPPGWFYRNIFLNESTFVSYAYQLGVFSATVLPHCGVKGYLPADRSAEIAYYRELQTTLNASDDTMYQYVQQWLCVTTPDDPDDYERALLQFEKNLDDLRVWFLQYQIELQGKWRAEELQEPPTASGPILFGRSDQPFFPQPRSKRSRDNKKG